MAKMGQAQQQPQQSMAGWWAPGTDADSLEVWAGGAASVGGLPGEMDSTRVLVGAYAVLHKVG